MAAIIPSVRSLAASGNAALRGDVLLTGIGTAYLTQDGNLIRISGSGSAGGGATVFTGLTDVPSAYAGNSGQVLRVNTGVSGLEYVSPTGDWLGQYVLKTGRAAGQIIRGDSAAGGSNSLKLYGNLNNTSANIALDNDFIQFRSSNLTINPSTNMYSSAGHTLYWTSTPFEIGSSRGLLLKHVFDGTNAPNLRVQNYGAGQTGHAQIWETSAVVPMSYVNVSGNFGIRMASAQSQGYLHLQSGRTGTNHAPLVFTSGNLLTNPLTGALEYDGRLHVTEGAAALRQQFTKTIYTSTGDAVVVNTTTESSLTGVGYGTTELPAHFFIPGKTVRIAANGYYSTVAVPGTLNFKIKLGSTVMATTAAQTAPSAITNELWKIEAPITCRVVGSAGSGMSQSTFEFKSTALGTFSAWDMINTANVALDTTSGQILDLTATWGTADAGNSITCTNFIVETLN